MKCTVGPNDYHLLVRPKFNITIYDCQCQVTARISGSLPYDTIEDIKDLEGLQAAKDAWWELYLWIREQERIQDE
jgi:hypothetical protein